VAAQQRSFSAAKTLIRVVRVKVARRFFIASSRRAHWPQRTAKGEPVAVHPRRAVAGGRHGGDTDLSKQGTRTGAGIGFATRISKLWQGRYFSSAEKLGSRVGGN